MASDPTTAHDAYEEAPGSEAPRPVLVVISIVALLALAFDVYVGVEVYTLPTLSSTPATHVTAPATPPVEPAPHA